MIGVIQYALVLLEIDADHHLRAPAQDVAGAAQKSARLMRLEIAERRSREEADLWHARDRLGQCEWRGKIGGDRKDVERGEIPAQNPGPPLPDTPRNIPSHRSPQTPH